MRAGDRVLEPGDPITAGAVALLAAAGRARVAVHRRPRLGVLTSGDELRGPDAMDEVCAGRGIPDSNGPMLAAAAAELGVETVMLGPAPDRADELRTRLERARSDDLDLLVTVGGASMGGTDLFRDVLGELGVAFDFWRVRIRPGSPFSAAVLPRPGRPPLPVLGLPGNPASAFVTFHLFVRPALLTLAGHGAVDLPAVGARAGAVLAGGGELTHFVRVRLTQDGAGLVAEPTGPQGSGLVRGLASADGLAVVPRGTSEIAPGATVEVLLLRLPHARPRGAAPV
jgi:molybdopterin molybdotransferase